MNIGLGIGIPFTRSSLWASIFTPSALFLDGSTQGVWYDPSDINLTWRRNLLTYSEQFDNAAWTNVQSSDQSDTAVAPDGTTTADTLIPTSGSRTESGLTPTSAPTLSAASHVVSVYFKAAGKTFGYLQANTGTSVKASFVTFDLSNGTAGAITALAGGGVTGASAAISSIGSGWYRCSLTYTAEASGNQVIFGCSDAVNSRASTGNGTSGIYIWGAQLEQGSTATPYQRITDGVQDYLQYQAQPVLYQNAAGTLPVTAVEQPVGLMLDKSKGLVLGPELVTNGTFDTDVSGWAATAGANLSWVAGSANVSFNAIADVGISQVFTRPSGYSIVTATITRNFTGATSVNLSLGGYVHQKAIALGETITLSVLSYRATAGLSTVLVRTAVGTPTGDFTVDNISVRELPGNHAFNPSGNSANFPVLSARYNLLTKTEQFDDAVWIKTASTVTANATTAPDGTATADLVIPSTASAQHYFKCDVAETAGNIYIYSVYAKANGYRFLRFGPSNTTVSVDTCFDLQTGTVSVSNAPASASITSVGDGWYKCTLTFTASITTTGGLFFSINNASSTSTTTYAGDGTSGIYVWGADLRVTNDALNQPAYQRVNTASDYDTVGFKPYLRFNGVSQWLQTNSIDFTYGDKMFVCAGVRKLSDAATGLLTEFSASTATNAGSFFVALPIASTASYRFESKGTVISSASSLFAAYPAPITNVLTGIGDISGDQAILRVNGVQAASSTADQGTGNFGNYPLYIGARGGSSLWFNGRLYGMVVAGKQASAAEIQDTEKYMNLKTAAYN